MKYKINHLIVGSLLGCGILLLTRVFCWGAPNALAQPASLASSMPVFFLFLIWNVFLAWMPYALSRQLAHLVERKVWIGIVLFLWILFYPNAPYIVTDLIHLRARPPYPLWYDLFVLFSFACTGLLLGAYSTINVQKFVLGFAPKVAKFLPWMIIPLGSIGVYLGRFLRWNSWDVFTRPMYLLADLVHHIQEPGFLPEFLVLFFPLSFIQGLFFWVLKEEPIQDTKSITYLNI
jgi:uncharacterized membrane protein